MIRKKVEEPTKNLTLQDIVDSKTDELVENATSSDLVSMIAMSQLTNLDNTKVITRLKIEQVPILTKLYLFADVLGIKFTKNIADNIAHLQISINGRGRNELVRVVNQSVGKEEEIYKGRKEIFR